MEKITLLEALSQVGSCEAGEILRSFLRETVRKSYLAVMLEEVSALCGPKHRPEKTSGYFSHSGLTT